MHIRTKDNTQLYYEVHGNGDALILLHGNGEDTTYFTHQIAFFKSRFLVIAIDMRGHGKSDVGKTELNFDVFAQDVLEVMDHLHIQKAHILGFSDGGNTAITLAFTYPNRIQSLIANGADMHPSGVKRSVQIPIILGYWLLCLFPKKYCYQKQQVMNLMVHHPAMQCSQLACILCPTLVLVGHKDMIKESHSKRITQAIPNARMEVMKGSHFIARERYEEYNQIVLDFLVQVP